MRSGRKDKLAERRKKKHIQLAFYETSGNSSSTSNSVRRERSSSKLSRSSRNRDTRSKEERRRRYARDQKNTGSLPYLQKELKHSGVPAEYVQRNSSFTMLVPQQYGYSQTGSLGGEDSEASTDAAAANTFHASLSESMGHVAVPQGQSGLGPKPNGSQVFNSETNRMKLPNNLPILRLGVPSVKARGMLILKNVQSRQTESNVPDPIEQRASAPYDGVDSGGSSTGNVNAAHYEGSNFVRYGPNNSRTTTPGVEGQFFSDLQSGPYDILDQNLPKLGARRVSNKKVLKLGDRLSGVMKARSEELAQKLLTSKKDEQNMSLQIKKDIIERRKTLPLDFIFRRALKRYVRAHQESGMKKWKSFVRRAKAIERLLMKVTPYAICIQRHIRGYLGRKRAAIMREIRRVELKRLRLNMSVRIQCWWRLVIVLTKIRIRTAQNLEAKRQRSATKLQWAFRGHMGRKKARKLLRIKLTRVMRDLLKYEHMLTEEEHVILEACSAILFDQRDDPRWERESIYTSTDIRRAITLCMKMEKSRCDRAKRKRDKHLLDIMKEKQRMKMEMLNKQKEKYAKKLAEEQAKLAEIACREEEERQHALKLKEEQAEAERLRKELEEQVLADEMKKIMASREHLKEDEEAERKALKQLEDIERERIAKLKAEDLVKSDAKRLRKEEQLRAQEEKLAKLGIIAKKEEEGDSKEEGTENPDDAAESKAPDTEEKAELKDAVTKKAVQRGGGDPFKVVCDTPYDTDDQDELNMNVGEEIIVLDRGDTSGDANWWNGENKATGASGIFPSDCIKVIRKKVIAKENFVPETEEELALEEGDYIAIFEWDGAEWWRGENMSSKKNGIFPSDVVITEEEFQIAEEKRQALEKKQEEEEMARMAEMAMEGIASQDDDDGERALRVVFDLLDYNRDGTLERKDIIYSCMDGGRMENILQACGKLRIWLRPSTIHRFVRCIDYPLNNGHGTFEQFKTFIRNPHVIEAKLLNQDKQVQDAKDKNEETKEEAEMALAAEAEESAKRKKDEPLDDASSLIPDTGEPDFDILPPRGIKRSEYKCKLLPCLLKQE